ncbi:hypothetical protein PG997_010256 [Apiospora hydei]|uniref:Protein kinase domain-containing protein n=1 Tax=Apiospora hydei TaxID=1337664 RepID=A0ABR1VWI2_9PEZI
MAQSRSTPYNDIGIYLPYHNAGHGNQWAHDEKLYSEGFLLVEAVSRNEFVVQSLGNGKLYLHKLLEGGGQDFVGPRPPELKVSTSPAGAGARFGTGYANDPQNIPPPDRSREPGWWRAEDSDHTAMTDATQGSREDEETENGDDYEDADWMPGQEEKGGDVKMRGGGGNDDGEEKPWWHDIMAEGEEDEEDDTAMNEEEQAAAEAAERESRDLEVLLPADEECFAKLMFWQRLQESPVPVYSLYFEHSNGGTLAGLRDAYRATSRRVPEHFIWHVAAQLGEALVHLYNETVPDDEDSEFPFASDSEAEEDVAGGEGGEERKRHIVYHRDLFAGNVAVHYRSPKGGPKPRGERTNAFPEIRLSGFGRAFIEGDPIKHVQPRASDDGDAEDSSYPEEWEDVAAFGTILRELATTHIIAPTPKRATATSTASASPAPTASSTAAAAPAFEWAGMPEHPELRLRDARADGTFGYQDLPPMRWVADTLLLMARRMVQFQDRCMSWGASSSKEDPEALTYRNLDVSWTKPGRLMPFVCGDHTSAHGVAELKRVQALLGPWDGMRGKPYEFVKVNFPSPKVSLVVSARRKGVTEREKLAPHLEAALREPLVAAAATPSGSSPDSDERSGRLKRARHH